ncbi:hypothetical protein GGR54DRAFT_66276 [Hypoxylon sp. NC1633]|nr:hypothetical protein GGR54DRAFT_66276 [Hypoxylon sp. NC1633]
MAPLELFVLNWGTYPRRVLIYLNEKGLLHSPLIKITESTYSPTAGMVAPGKPTGTVPILALPDGTFIKQSVAILEYLEEICQNPQEEWQKELAASAKPISMLGHSTWERAAIREILALVDEAASFFGFACRKGSKLFVSRELMSRATSDMAMGWTKRCLKLVEPYYEGRFAGGGGSGGNVTITDCALFSLLQFSRELYGRNLPEEADLPNLKRFYEVFKERESARITDDFYPREIKEVACIWLE